MKILQITLNVPIIDLDENERQRLLEQLAFGEQEVIDEGLPTLADYVAGATCEASGLLIAEVIAGHIESEADGEMWAGSEIYVQVDPSVGVKVKDAKWLD